jgi:hypothetical protein
MCRNIKNYIQYCTTQTTDRYLELFPAFGGLGGLIAMQAGDHGLKSRSGLLSFFFEICTLPSVLLFGLPCLELLHEHMYVHSLSYYAKEYA